MGTFETFARLGFRHITDVGAADHILFLVVLAVAYRASDWRDVLGVVTAFTIGHSATLALAVTDTLRLPQATVEFLIPVTIVAAGVETLVMAARRRAGGVRRRYRPLLAGAFGLVHGAGFATYLRELFGGSQGIALPLLGFNVGLELGQLAVLGAIAAVLWTLDAATAAARPRLAPADVVRLRAGVVSLGVVVVAARWAAERAPW